jgi:hypothetical protein
MAHSDIKLANCYWVTAKFALGKRFCSFLKQIGTKFGKTRKLLFVKILGLDCHLSKTFSKISIALSDSEKFGLSQQK